MAAYARVQDAAKKANMVDVMGLYHPDSTLQYMSILCNVGFANGFADITAFHDSHDMAARF